MEDAHTNILRLNKRFNTSDPKKLENELNKESPKDELHYSFFAVFDGHGGPSVAKYSGEHLHWKLIEEEAFDKKDFKKALKDAYLNIDKDMLTGKTYYNINIYYIIILWNNITILIN